MAQRTYTPQLTRWRAAAGGGAVHSFVEHEGTVLAVEADDQRECVEIGGRVFAVADEVTVAAAGGGAAFRCVDYAGVRLTLTEDNEAAEVVGGALRVLEFGGCFDDGAGAAVHVVDVQGEREAFVLLACVREEHRRIVRVQRIN